MEIHVGRATPAMPENENQRKAVHCAYNCIKIANDGSKHTFDGTSMEKYKDENFASAQTAEYDLAANRRLKNRLNELTEDEQAIVRDRTCNVSNAMRACLSACDNSTMKMQTSVSMLPTDTMCATNRFEYLRAFKCEREKYDMLKRDCEKEQERFDSLVESIDKAPIPDTIDMDNVCNTTIEVSSCWYRSLSTHCGRAAAELDARLLRAYGKVSSSGPHGTVMDPKCFEADTTLWPRVVDVVNRRTTLNVKEYLANITLRPRTTTTTATTTPTTTSQPPRTATKISVSHEASESAASTHRHRHQQKVVTSAQYETTPQTTTKTPVTQKQMTNTKTERFQSTHTPPDAASSATRDNVKGEILQYWLAAILVTVFSVVLQWCFSA